MNRIAVLSHRPEFAPYFAPGGWDHYLPVECELAGIYGDDIAAYLPYYVLAQVRLGMASADPDACWDSFTGRRPDEIKDVFVAAYLQLFVAFSHIVNSSLFCTPCQCRKCRQIKLTAVYHSEWNGSMPLCRECYRSEYTFDHTIADND